MKPKYASGRLTGRRSGRIAVQTYRRTSHVAVVACACSAWPKRCRSHRFHERFPARGAHMSETYDSARCKCSLRSPQEIYTPLRYQEDRIPAAFSGAGPSGHSTVCPPARIVVLIGQCFLPSRPKVLNTTWSPPHCKNQIPVCGQSRATARMSIRQEPATAAMCRSERGRPG